MAISKSYTDSLINSIGASTKSYQTSVSGKSTSEQFKSYDSYNTNNFSNVLNLTNVSKGKTNIADDKEVENAKTSNENDDMDNVNELNEKLKKLEDESKPDSKDEANEVLEELLALLAQFGIKEDKLKLKGKIDQGLLNTLLEKMNNQGSGKSSTDIMDKIMEFLKKNSVKDNINADSLKSISNILNNLSSKTSENEKNIRNLMSKIYNMFDGEQSQGNKALTLEDMLNKNYSQDSNEKSSTSNDNKELSKEDKFLNSLIDDKKDDSLNKINLFASRVSTIQNQGVNTVRGLTINKATMVDDLIKDVKYMSNNSLKELTVKVNPGNLGEITIKLIQEDGLMKANLKVNSKETAALLSQNLAEIKKQLGEQSIKFSDVNIELYQDDTTFFKEQGFEGQFSNGQNNKNSGSQNSVSTTQNIVSEDLIENLAEENNNVNAFA